MDVNYKKYKKEDEYSYALGPFPTFEMIENSPQNIVEVFIDEDFNQREKLEDICIEKGITYSYNKKILDRISNKEICYAAGVFKQFSKELQAEKAHVVLNNPSDMGNLGTILRTLLGFGIKDIAIIKPAADIFNPKVIRASMGAMFRMNFCHFDSFQEYINEYGEGRDVFPFMLDGKKTLSIADCPKSSKYTLVFGNEAKGLPPEFAQYGTSIFIPQSHEVDSLNLAVSVAVGSFIFTSVNK